MSTSIGTPDTDVFPYLIPDAREMTSKLLSRGCIRFAARCIFAGLLIPGAVPHAHAETRTVQSLLEMRHKHVVIQKWDLSCGAAALATLLQYQHGEQVTERDLALAMIKRKEYIDNPQLLQIREGFSLLDLARQAESRGYTGKAFGKMQFKDLIEKAPILVPITTNGYNHFVVFRGVRADRVVLADPAWGNRTMLLDEFMQKWIDYPELGHIGFIVERLQGESPENLLDIDGRDFVMLR